MPEAPSSEASFKRIAIEVLAAIVVVGVVAALRYFFGEPVPKSEIPAAVIAITLVAYAVLRFGIFVPVRWLLEKSIEPRLRREILAQESARITREAIELERKRLCEITGIVEILPNFRQSQKEILGALQSSKTVRVFLQLGRTVMGGSTDFYDLLEQKTDPASDVRILHARMDSPYLSERVAHQRGSNYRGWHNELDHAIKTVAVLTEQRQGRVVGRQHSEGYTWRLFLTDTHAYVQPYLYDKNNSELAPVLKIARTIDGTEIKGSLYRVFSAYFDQKWDENVPKTSSLAEIIPRAAACAVAGVLSYHQFFIFAIPKRYIDRAGTEVPFHGIGGKVAPPETFEDALHREAQEELGAQIQIQPASRTRYFTTSAELEPVAIGDLPRPYCLYRKTRQQDPNFHHEDVLWLVGYEGKVQVSSLDQLRPGAEVGALLCLTKEMLRRTLVDDLSFKGIISLSDGSRVIVAPGVKLDLSRRAVPSGVAALVASEHLGSVTYQP